jgi:membrane-bound lytic murein transglycosylase D
MLNPIAKFRAVIVILTAVSLPATSFSQQFLRQFVASSQLAFGDDLSSLTDDDSSDSYLATVSKKSEFHATGDDLLVAKAEQQYDSGKRAYQSNRLDEARQAFDTAVDLMLQAAEHPSDRELYENKLDHMVDSIHRLDLAGLGAAARDQEPQFEKAPLDPILTMTFPVDPTIKNKVVDEVKSTSSQLPLVVNDTVLSYIHYFSGRGHATIVAGLQRAGKYRPMIERILKEEKVPLELIHLAQAESGFLPRAVSNRAATGMWQFVKYRGQEYGLNQTAFADERLDPEKATRAAARHLHDLYNQFGNWYLAIAAYNCGPGNVQRAIERTGYADYWELRARHAIPVETSNYVPIILAMTIMTKNAAEYDLENITPEAPLEYDALTLNSPTHLALIGDVTDTPVSELVSLNPALLKSVAPQGYTLRVPKGTGEALTAALVEIPMDRRLSWRMHHVQSGETLMSIARQYGTGAGEIAALNRLSASGPNTGDRLLIPASFHPDVQHASSARHAKNSYAHRTVRLARGRSVVRSSNRPRSASVRNVSVRHTLAKHSSRRSGRAA